MTSKHAAALIILLILCILIGAAEVAMQFGPTISI
jgi:hypothetical protein